MEKVDLTNCDREPIHIPGTIQPHGAMLVCDPADGTIVYASANTPTFLGRPWKTLIGAALGEAIGEDAAHDLRNAAAKAGGSHLSGVLLGHTLPGSPDRFNLAIHHNEGRVCVEIERATTQEDSHAALDLTQAIIRRIGLETEVDRIAGETAKLVRATLGYDRVMVYRFLHNGAGKVIAEARRSDLHSYLNQYFPASDIPAQARRLYLANWTRMIGDIGYDPVPLLPPLGAGQPPIDLSFAQLRSVSPIHCEYLANMGVAASMSISIIVDGALWGLIACHHDTPKYVPIPLRIGADLFGQYFSLQIALAERRAEFVAAAAARRRIEALGATFVDQDIETALRDRLAAFVDLIPCDGIGLWLGGKWSATGITPAAEDIAPLVALVDARAQGRLWYTHELFALLGGTAFGSAVAGALAIPVGTPNDYLILFRSEEAYNIEWAGEPKKIAGGPSGERLTPRGSFEAWREEVRHQSSPWIDAEIVVAEAVRSFLRDVVLRHNDAVADERSRTDQRRRLLNDELNHRVKNIITLVKSIAAQTGATATSVEQYSTLLEGRLRALAFAHDQSLGGSGGDLRVLLEAEASLHRDDAILDKIVVEGPPIGLNDRAFGVIALLMHEMITNAAKYGALSTRQGRLSVRWALGATGDCTIEWNESGGPPVVVPETTGFGTKLIQSTISHDLGGTARIDYAPSGLRGEFVVPGRHLQEPPARVETLPPAAAEPADLVGLSVLLVEDQALVAMDTERTLRGLGAVAITLAASAAEALAILSKGTPGCAVLDLNLGDGTSVVIADRLLESGVPFVFATGYGDSAMIPQRFAAIPVARKPLNGQDLAGSLRMAMAART